MGFSKSISKSNYLMSNAEPDHSYNNFHQGVHCYGHFPVSSPGSRIYHHVSLLLKLSSVSNSKPIVMSANRWSRLPSSWSLGCGWLFKSSRLRCWSKWRPSNDRRRVSWTYTEQYRLCEASCPTPSLGLSADGGFTSLQSNFLLLLHTSTSNPVNLRTLRKALHWILLDK